MFESSFDIQKCGTERYRDRTYITHAELMTEDPSNMD